MRQNIAFGKTTLKDKCLKIAEEMNDSRLKRAIKRAGDNGAWLTMNPLEFNGTELSATEFRDNLALRYGMDPIILPTKCDGCDSEYSIEHALRCKKGGLVHQRHNEVCGELQYLSMIALSAGSIRNEPMIHPLPSDIENRSKNNDRGDILIRGLWERQKDCIIDVRVTNVDSPSYLGREAENIILTQEKEKRDKYESACSDQRRDFSPFVVTTDGLLGPAAKEIVRKLAQILARKWDSQYSVVCSFVRARISVAIARATNRCIRGSRISTKNISLPIPHWEDVAGLKLFRTWA